MPQAPNIDGVLIQWGDRLFFPGNRIVPVRLQPKLRGQSAQQRAAAIRQRIEATVVRRAPQVMVKVTGGGRGMKAIAAHFRYISKNGRLDIEDERGDKTRGKDALHELADDWRFGGTLIDDIAEPGQRREAFNIMLSMPRGTDPLANHLDIGDQPRGNPNRNRRTYGHRSCRAQRRDSFAQSSVGQRALSLHNLALGTDRGRIATDGRGVEVGARHLTLRRTTAIAPHSSGGRGRAFATPSFEVRSTPGDRAFGQPHRARKPVFSDHAIDRRSAQAGHAGDGSHAQECHRIVAMATTLGRIRLPHFVGLCDGAAVATLFANVCFLRADFSRYFSTPLRG